MTLIWQTITSMDPLNDDPFPVLRDLSVLSLVRLRAEMKRAASTDPTDVAFLKALDREFTRRGIDWKDEPR
jgi:hypothetical protein